MELLQSPEWPRDLDDQNSDQGDGVVRSISDGLARTTVVTHVLKALRLNSA